MLLWQAGHGEVFVASSLVILTIVKVVGAQLAFQFPKSQWLQHNDTGAAAAFDVSAFRAAADSPHLWVFSSSALFDPFNILNNTARRLSKVEDKIRAVTRLRKQVTASSVDCSL
jgi:hypothetical protein